MQWYHECDIEWMKARQKCLTATDVKDLLPVTKTGRKRTVSDESYFKVLASKLVNVTDEDCKSTGVMARGHVLEPFAIEEYNRSLVERNTEDPTIKHWDDVVITRGHHTTFGLAFSPDGLDVAMPDKTPSICAIHGMREIAEVKCYNAERHTVCGYTSEEDLEEKWQVAVAMAVSDEIDTARLLFYNPSMENQLYVVTYDRSDLSDEIEMVLDVEEDWLAWTRKLGTMSHHLLIEGDVYRENIIVEDILETQKLNPDGKKSVVL